MTTKIDRISYRTSRSKRSTLPSPQWKLTTPLSCMMVSVMWILLTSLGRVLIDIIMGHWRAIHRFLFKLLYVTLQRITLEGHYVPWHTLQL